jgi:uncharacterized protein involved in exopolysaccharide biosynthesis
VANAKRPRTGERRQINQPLKIDKLPPDVHERILALRNRLGKTWEEIESISAQPFDEKKQVGLVNWAALPAAVVKLFPGKRLAHTSLHRWYDLRVSQVRRDVEQRSVIARQLAESFAKSVVSGGNEAVTNAARDQLMSLLAEDLTPKGRTNAAKGLIALAEILQAARANDIKERKVAVDVRKIKLLEDREKAARERVDQATQQAAKKGTGQFSIDDINLLRERTFGLPPLVVA